MSITATVTPDKWSSVFNPAIIKLVRKDWEYTSIEESVDSYVKLVSAGNLDSDIMPGDTIYVAFDTHPESNGEYEILICNPPTGEVTIGLLYSTIGETDTGYINDYTSRAGYYSIIRIYNDTGLILISEAYYSGKLNESTYLYEIKADISQLALGEFSKDNVSTYDDFVIKETNLFKGLRYKYAEVWQDFVGDPTFSSFGYINMVCSAMQLKHIGGGSLNLHEISINPPKLGKFLTSFERPTIVPGLPFDLSIIYDGIETEVGVHTLYFCMQNGTTMPHIEKTVFSSPLVADNIVRIMPHSDLIISSKNLKAYIIDDFASVEYVASEELPIDIIEYCTLDNLVYLCWINRWGGWDYWAFNKNFVEDIQVESDEYEYYIEDYETADGNSDLINVKSFDIITIGAHNLSTQQVEGLKSLLTSPRVLMLMNPEDYYNNYSLSPMTQPIWTIVKVVPETVNTKQSAFDGKHNIELKIRTQYHNVQNL